MQTVESYDGPSFISTTEKMQNKLHQGYTVVSMMTSGRYLYVVYDNPPVSPEVVKAQHMATI